ncbi:MAG: hypothetical protein IKA31_02175 [Clostridia bacterium]|nr:hypothetical protein [Clostridia bacterium]MBR4002642.1 hypothetical protein [Clostridia bacterium]
MDFIDNKESKFKEILLNVKEEERLGMHSFHRYYGKLIPAIPRAFIREFTKVGDLVFDPFSGSGTTALESRFLDRNFIGVEINPLSVLISKIKTNNYSVEMLKRIQDKLLQLIDEDKEEVKAEEIPFVINRDHWFKDFVQRDLVIIRRNFDKAVDEFIDDGNKEKYIDFLIAVLSAIVKQVSNADTMHVFPGISKRMRRLESEGKIKINVFDTFRRALKKRIQFVEQVGKHDVSTNIMLGDSANIDLSQYSDKVDLVVTNPPYISSVRYAETLKLELYWLEVTKSSSDYMNLSNSMIGNDHIAKKDCIELQLTKYDFVNDYIKQMYEIDKKQAKVLYDYFSLMEKVIIKAQQVLKSGKKLVMKISDSKIRKIKIPTGYLLTKIAEENGFKLIDVFNDKINENSRSLLTSRNTYSDIILEDNIIFWEKK